jgi:hypothetical protein
MITWRLKISPFSNFGVQWNGIDAMIFHFQFKPITSFGTSSHLPHKICIYSVIEDYASVVFKEGINKAKCLILIFRLENISFWNVLGI